MKLDRHSARAILSQAGVPVGADFHTLRSEAVDSLLVAADRYGYRKPANANGSRGRYWCAYLQRVATREEG